MGRSHTLRVYRLQLIAHFGLAFATAARLRRLTLLQTSNSPDHYAKGTPSAESSSKLDGQPPTACRRMVSGSATPHLGFFSPFPHGTGSLSVTREYLALRDGPRRFPPDFSCPAVLGRPGRSQRAFVYRTFTFCGPSSQTVRLACWFLTPRALSPTGSRNTSARKRARV